MNNNNFDKVICIFDKNREEGSKQICKAFEIYLKECAKDNKNTLEKCKK